MHRCDEEFEKWAQWYRISLRKTKNGKYCSTRTRHYYHAWQGAWGTAFQIMERERREQRLREVVG